MNVILCGLPGSGKSTLGRLLARELALPFYDTDKRIEESYGGNISCREIYIQLGEKKFRELEYLAIEELEKFPLGVVSVGGGAFSSANTLLLLKRLGKVIYLEEEIETLFIRATKKGVPAYLDPDDPFSSFSRLAQARLLLYRQHADHIFFLKRRAQEELAKDLLNLVK